MQLSVVHEVASLRDALSGLAAEGKRVALVPTMGALHAGHAVLVEAGKILADAVVVSIFVNPKQFGKNEDFNKYPRNLKSDVEVMREAGAAIVYAPPVEDMYPPGFSTHLSPGEIGNILCGKFRPGHFDAVATVVAKLFLQVLPHVAVFGEKDYQQLCIISRMGRDLDLPIEVVGVPTVREADGLAMSSRNAYLTAQERKKAPKLYETLFKTATAIAEGVAPAQAVVEGQALLAALGFKPDYMELRASVTLDPLATLVTPARLLGAAWLGETRLIDNIAIEEPPDAAR